MNKYMFRAFETGDEEDIVSLLDQVFDGWPKFDLLYSSLDYWKWKFRDNPVKRGNVCSVALKEGDIVGCMHDFQILCKFGKKSIFVGQGCDLAVQPEHRRHGLYNNMLAILDKSRQENNISMTISVSRNPVVSERSKRRGFPRLQSPALFLVKVKDIDLHLKHRPLENHWLIKIGVNLLKKMQKFPEKKYDAVTDFN